jgi:cell division GTPase FtsZ
MSNVLRMAAAQTTTNLIDDLELDTMIIPDTKIVQPASELKRENMSDTNAIESDKLSALKAKLAAKQTEDTMPLKIVEKKTRSIRFGVIGSGQAGSRLAETFHALGYDAVAFNTAPQDLEHIALPEDNKYLLQYGLGGAAKEMDIGREAAETHRDAINELIQDKLSDAQVFMFCLSLGGGSGAGSCETIVDVLSGLGKPIVVITVLPMDNDDAQTKRNALETLSKLAKEAQNKRIHNLIVVDNARIESIYSNVSQIDFFKVSNTAIVEPIDAFNTLSSMPSAVKGLDPMEFAKLITDGGGLTVYGEMSVPNYEEDTAIAEAVIQNLNSGLLASGFDLKQSKYVGVLIAANKKVWDKIPSSSVNYAMSMVHDICGTPTGVFRGIYATDVDEDVVRVYSMFSGLGLPESRVQQLKKEAQEYAQRTKNKDDSRNLTLKLDTGTDDAISAADKIKQKIASKKSAFGGLVNNSIQDRRRK